MKITKAKLKQIIQEELSSLMEHNEETKHLMKDAPKTMIFDQNTASSMLQGLERLMDRYHDIRSERELTPEEAEELEKLWAQYLRIMNAGLDAGYGS